MLRTGLSFSPLKAQQMRESFISRCSHKNGGQNHHGKTISSYNRPGTSMRSGGGFYSSILPQEMNP
jgi:hypothetical protein